MRELDGSIELKYRTCVKTAARKLIFNTQEMREL